MLTDEQLSGIVDRLVNPVLPSRFLLIEIFCSSGEIFKFQNSGDFITLRENLVPNLPIQIRNEHVRNNNRVGIELDIHVNQLLRQNVIDLMEKAFSIILSVFSKTYVEVHRQKFNIGSWSFSGNVFTLCLESYRAPEIGSSRHYV